MTSSSFSSAQIKIQNPALLSVETALNMAYGEKLLDEVKPFDYFSSTVSDEDEKRNRDPKVAAKNANGDESSNSSSTSDDDDENSKKKAIDVDNDGNSDNNKEAPKKNLIFRTDTALWFVPDFHPIEIVGISADPVSKNLYCTIKMEQLEGFDVSPQNSKKKSSSDKDDDNDEDEEDESITSTSQHDERKTRMFIAPLAKVRKHFPQLIIDHLLNQAVYEQ
jgi:hypothetical protein